MKAETKTKKTRRSKYTDEFKAGAVRLVAEGRSPATVAQDLGVLLRPSTTGCARRRSTRATGLPAC